MPPEQIEHLKKLVAALAEWQLCMSYNDSYFGEPAGLVKRTSRELTKLLESVERTTSPVSQMTDDLARAAKALLEEQEAACLTDAMKALEEMELCHEQVEVSAKLLRKLFLALAAAAPHAQAPAAQQESIDTPGFRDLLIAAQLYGDDPTHYTEGKDALAAHIDAHTAAAVAKARKQGEFDGAALMAETVNPKLEELTRRAERAEAALAQHSAKVPDGWKLVPVEPTHAMISGFHGSGSYERLVYDKMLAAAAPVSYPTRECAAEALTPSVAQVGTIGHTGEVTPAVLDACAGAAAVQYKTAHFNGLRIPVPVFSAAAQPQPVAEQGELLPEWISEVCGPEVDDLSYGQGYRRGFNDCRKKVIELRAAIAASQQAAEPVAWPDWLKIEDDTLLIHGIRYSQELFQHFGGALPLGEPFMIDGREKDGALTVLRLDRTVWPVAKGGE